MKILIALLVMGILGYIGYSTSKPEKTKPPQSGVVYYYPKANVYYEVATGHYVYFDGKTGAWYESKSFSEEQKLSLGERAVLKNPTYPLWKNNAADRMLYSARLYSSTQNLSQKFREDSIRSIPKPVTITQPAMKKEKADTEEKDSVKHKTGIRRFFERLFGGRKKENKEQ